MARLPKGETTKLNYSIEARQRICVGISWDAIEEDVERPELYNRAPSEKEKDEGTGINPYGHDIDAEIGSIKETFDVDLICLIFNADGELVDAVSPMDGEEVDQTGQIYHSGDERHGASINEDEIISVELKGLADHVHHMVFLAIIQSGHDFSYIENPEFRVYDSKRNTDMLAEPISGPEAEGKTAYVLCRIFRGSEDWMIHHIGEFRVDTDVADWGAEVKPYLS